MSGEDRLLLFRPPVDAGDALAIPRGHRAIGVVYQPEFEWGTMSRPSCPCGTTPSSTWTEPGHSTRYTSSRKPARLSSIPGAFEANVYSGGNSSSVTGSLSSSLPRKILTSIVSPGR